MPSETQAFMRITPSELSLDEGKKTPTPTSSALPRTWPVFLGADFVLTKVATPTACYRSLSGPRSVPGVSLGVSLGPFGPRAPESPESVPRVSRECQKGVRALRGHSRDTLGDTFWIRSPGPEGPQRHPEEHSRHTSGPKGPRDSCSRPAGLQH